MKRTLELIIQKATTKNRIWTVDWDSKPLPRDGAVSTVAGNGESGFADGEGGAARFDRPKDVVVDKQGTMVGTDAGKAPKEVEVPHKNVDAVLQKCGKPLEDGDPQSVQADNIGGPSVHNITSQTTKASKEKARRKQ